MLDGKQLQSLVAVADLQSFEKAAAHLGVTQPALSQRIGQLEDRVGRPLVVRSPQTKMTKAGERLARFARQRFSLENDVMASLGADDAQRWPSLAIGVNADSLATWFQAGLAPLKRSTVIELTVRDQTETIDVLREGGVLACVSSWPKAVQGCSCEPLGKMSYRCVASREALARVGERTLSRGLAQRLPAVVFGRHDDILADYVKQSVGLDRHEYPSHIVPSTADLLRFVAQGFGYSLLPALQINAQLKSGRLVDIAPSRKYEVPLFWHRWKIATELLDEIGDSVRAAARKALIPI